jgi:hypothetical protein
MGRNVLTQLKLVNIAALLVCLCALCPISFAQSPERSLLLVAGDQNDTVTFSHAELRKIFLGIPVTRNDVRIKPILNLTDPLAMDVFLQQVVFMSEREYKRQLLSRVFRLGGPRPPEYDDIDELVDALRDAPGSLTFMWAEQFETRSGLVSLGVLWASSTD